MNKQQLASRIWASANQMRSKIEANEYKDYILGFIFYKFLSDHEEQFARSKGLDEQGMRDELRETNAEAVSLIQPKLGYFISYENLFSTWIKPKKTGEDEFDVSNVRDAIGAFNRLIAPTHKKVFVGIFKTLETGLSKLGDSATTQTKAIKKLLNLIRDIPMDGRQDYDVLGFIYEYLISMFAANAGKKAGEFYTPHEVALFMAEIVADHLKERKTIEIYDPTSGSGSLLINIGRAVTRHLNDPDKIKYYAQELKENTYNLTRMNLVMRGIIPGNIEVRNGDTLERDWPYFDEENPDTTYDPLFVDAVVSNPPYSQHWTPKNRESDPRYAGFGIAPKSKADYAFLLHDLYHLRDDGIMTIVLPHGVLFRGKPDDGSEGSIRRALVEGNHIDAIIGLPPNIFFGTGIPTIVVVLRKQRDRDDVLIVDASRGFVKDGKKNKLRACDVKRITDAVTGHLEMPGFSRKVSRDKIRSNGYNLNIPRYIANRETEHWDVRAIMFGGIPACELDELAKYWDVFRGLRGALFTTRGNYAMVKVEDIGKAIINVSSVKEYTATFAKALDGLDALLKTELVDHCLDVTVNTEEEKLSKELFSRVEKLPLIDKYDAYQILDDEWRQTSIDLEIIQTDGFDAVRAVDPNMVLKKSGDKTEEVQDGWVGRIFPFELVQQMFFAEELAEIKAKENEADRLAFEIASLAADVPEEERENILKDDGDDFDAAKLKELMKEIGKERDFDEDTVESIAIKASELIAEEKRVRSELRKLKKSFELKTIAKIKALTDDEAKTLLEEKWVKPVVRKLMSMPETIVEGLATTIKALAAKYATTLSDVEDKIEESESKIAEMIGELDGTDDDMAGITAWKKELAR